MQPSLPPRLLGSSLWLCLPIQAPRAALRLGWKAPPQTLVHTGTGTLAVLWDCFRGEAGGWGRPARSPA